MANAAQSEQGVRFEFAGSEGSKDSRGQMNNGFKIGRSAKGKRRFRPTGIAMFSNSIKTTLPFVSWEHGVAPPRSVKPSQKTLYDPTTYQEKEDQY